MVSLKLWPLCPKCLVYIRLEALQCRSGCFGEEKNLLSQLGFAPQISLNVVSLENDLPVLHTCTPVHCPLGESDWMWHCAVLCCGGSWESLELGEETLLFELVLGFKSVLAISLMDKWNRARYCKFNPSMTLGFKFGGRGSFSFKLPNLHCSVHCAEAGILGLTLSTFAATLNYAEVDQA